MTSRFMTTCVLATVLLLSTTPSSALETTATNDAQTLAEAAITGTGITLGATTYSGAADASGTYSGGPLGIPDGALFTSGYADNALPPNEEEGATGDHMGAGDPLCDALIPGFDTYDAARLEVAFTLAEGFDGISFQYIVGSEEYPEFVGESYNDVVGVFIDGFNVALDEDGNSISINGPFFSSTEVIIESGTEYDGTTPKLLNTSSLTTGDHTLVIVVCDAGDSSLDTGLFIAGFGGCAGECGKVSWCGDGTVDASNGEECDDGNNVDGDGCTNDCKGEQPAPVCGDSTVDDGEECDDGNTANGDGCDENCMDEVVPDPVCGDGNLDDGEECDDGNTANGDGCDENCMDEVIATPICGDSNVDDGEECDDGNTANGDGCDENCAEESSDKDTDEDGLTDKNDNCPNISNPDQEDYDENGIGDACEAVEFEVTGGACSTSPTPGSTLPLLMFALLALALLLMRTSRRAISVLSAIFVLFLAGLPQPANAQQIETQAFRPSPFMGDLFTVGKGDTESPYKWNIGLFLNYQNDPLVLRELRGGKESVIREVVDHQVTGNILGAYRFLPWLALGIDIPVVMFQHGDGLGGFPEPGIAGLGDIRLIPRARLVKAGAFALAAEVAVSFPTGQLTDNYMGRSGLAAIPGLLASLDYARWGAALDISVLIGGADKYANLELSHALQGKLGAWVGILPDKLDFIAELINSFQLLRPYENLAESPTEVLAGLKWHIIPGLDGSLGGGAGITEGVASPDFRIFAGIMYGPVPKEPVVDPEPEPEPEPEPPKDTDGDGIFDDKDKCINDPEDKDGVADEDGCPEPDNDNDGICDPWVEERGEEAKYAKVCIPTDKCPNEPETKNSYQDDDGCPDHAVKLEAKKIVILQTVLFYFDETRIKEESLPLLDEVVQVLNDNPQLKRVRIEGHTDLRGDANYNRKLSDGRAKAVKDYLIGKGVKSERLSSKGFGESKPLLPTAQTDEEHLKNRRVEFIILEDK
jgi:large repetitive protein